MSIPTTYSWFLTTPTVTASSSTQGSGQGNLLTGQGKTGIQAPFAADGRGRLALCSGDNQLQKIIMLNLSDLESRNPFQDGLGLGADAVFAIASVKLRADLRRRITKLFRRLQLQDRARLNGQPVFTVDDNLGEMTCDISYINLEEDRPGTQSMKFSLANSTN